jgi:GAF domain-containing protein
VTKTTPHEVQQLRAEVDALVAENRQLYDDILRLRELQDAVVALGRARDQETITHVVAEAARCISGARLSRYYQRVDEDSAQLAVIGTGTAPPNTIPVTVLADGIAARVIARGRTVNCDDVSKDRRYRAKIDELAGIVCECLLCVPVGCRGDTVGAIEVANAERGAFDDDDQAALEALAAVAWLALDRLHARALVDRQVQSFDAPGSPSPQEPAVPSTRQRKLPAARAPRTTARAPDA